MRYYFLFLLLAVFLSLIVLPTVFQDAYAQPTITSYVANDPDDADAVYSNGDTITINLSSAANVTLGVITVDTDITGNFTFGPDPLDAATFTGEWVTTSQLVITLTSIGTNTLVVGTSTVDPSPDNNIGDLGAPPPDAGMASGSPDTLTGDFGLKSTGGGIYDSPPSYTTTFAENEYPISIGDTKFKREQLAFNVPTTIIETGKPVQVNLLIYDDRGSSDIAQVVLFTNINGVFRDVAHSDTFIIYKKGNPMTFLDPNGFFSDVILSSSVVNQKLQLTYEITFAKEMEKSDIIVQAKDTANNIGVLTVSEAWQVIQAPTVGETTETPTDVETTKTPTDEPTDGSALGETKVRTINVEKPTYYISEEILFFGTVDGYKFGTAVTMVVRNPSNNFLTLISTVPDKDGYFEAKTKIDSKFKTDGTYTITAFVDDPNKGMQAIFYFSRVAPPPPPVTTSPVQSTQAEQSTEPEPTTTFEPVTQSELVTSKPKPRPSFVDPEKDPQSYVDRYNIEESYKDWFARNFPDYTIYEAVGLAEPAKEKIPGWIKNNAKWWSEGQIDDDTFVSGIQFLMKQKIVDIPDLPEQASEKARPSFVDESKDPQSYVNRYNNEESYKEWFDENYPDYTIEEAVGVTVPIPGWIKNNAEWWSQGLITEDDFVKGIEFLVKNGIIKV